MTWFKYSLFYITSNLVYLEPIGVNQNHTEKLQTANVHFHIKWTIFCNLKKSRANMEEGPLKLIFT